MNSSQRTHAPFLAALAAASAFSLSAAAFAQVDSPPRSNPPAPTQEPQHHETMGQTNMGSTSGMHEMPATVISVDHNSGIVEVDSERMKLKVHFPTSTIADLKKGDKIKLQLGYSRE
jgi:hypothetical protein